MVKDGRWRLRHWVVFILLVFGFYISGQLFRSSFQSISQHQVNAVLNSTLGFTQIFAIVIPGSERRDPLLAAANATKIDLTIFDAVLPENIPKADIPERWGDNGYSPNPGVLGCLMSHVSIWRKVIDDNLSSALIVESDADFDMRIKQSMLGLSEGAKIIADFPFTPPSQTQPHSPYGDKWDILWIGHCGAHANGDGRSFAYEDSSAADSAHAWAEYAQMADNYFRANGTRLVFQLRDVVCSVAYAISNNGAHKMEQRFETVNQPIDLEMLKQCTTDPELVCLATFPQIISMVKELRSNIDGGTEGDKNLGNILTEKVIAGKGIQISARKNAALGFANQQSETWVKEWADQPT